MAVAFDAVGPSSAGTSGTASTLSWSHINAGNLLIVGVAVGATTDTGITTTATYNSVAMTSLGKVHTGGGTAGYCEMFYLFNPTAGTNTALITASTTPVSMEAGSVSFSGAGTLGAAIANPSGASVTSISTVVPTTSTAGMVVDVVAWGSGGVATSTQTQRWQKALNSTTGAGDAAQSTAASTGGNVTMSYSWTAADIAAMVAVEIQPASPARCRVVSRVPRIRAAHF